MEVSQQEIGIVSYSASDNINPAPKGPPPISQTRPRSRPCVSCIDLECETDDILCPKCREMADKARRNRHSEEIEPDYSGVLGADGSVYSDADPGL
jgi:hypothetical protein